jgi:hypothetical protein
MEKRKIRPPKNPQKREGFHIPIGAAVLVAAPEDDEHRG